MCNYQETPLCNLYDSSSDISGQATDVFFTTERNGAKTLTFTLPSTMNTENGVEDNYRLDFIVADYFIKATKKDHGATEPIVDWFLISEPKSKHEKYSKNIDITAKHFSQLLATKNLGLEFSAEEGNNVGKCEELAATILEGTGWKLGYVYPFMEDDGKTEKVRTLEAPQRTGAFKLMNQLCEIFEAKPIYNGNRTVSIVPLNPFSKDTEPGKIPASVLDESVKVIELYYDRNVKNLERTLNTDSLVTVLNAYGSYGDLNGFISLQTCNHYEYEFGRLEAGKYKFDTVISGTKYFELTETVDKLIYSDLDFMSRSYIWEPRPESVSDEEKWPEGKNGHAHHVFSDPADLNLDGEKPTELHQDVEFTVTTERNYFPFIMDFDYYWSVGLLSEDQFQKIADFQRTAVEYYRVSEEKAAEFSEIEGRLSNIAESNSEFLRLELVHGGEYTDVSGDADGAALKPSESGGVTRLNLKPESHGVLYRSDYDEAPKKRFSLFAAKRLMNNGEPTSGAGSVVYVIHPSEKAVDEQGVEHIIKPATYEKVYVKYYGNLEYEDEHGRYNYITLDTEVEPPEEVGANYHYSSSEPPEPNVITLWGKLPPFKEGDRLYLFSANSMTGKLGGTESSMEAAIDALKQETKVATMEHPTYFTYGVGDPDDDDDTDTGPERGLALQDYGWWYKIYPQCFKLGRLYFCCGVDHETAWHRCLFGDKAPEPNAPYFYNTAENKLYKREDGKWVWKDEKKYKDMADQFAKVVQACMQRERILKGLKDEYWYQVDPSNTHGLPAGNYALRSEYGFYWAFTTDRTIAYIPVGPDEEEPKNNGRFVYVTSSQLGWQDNNIKHIVKPEEKPCSTLEFPLANDILGVVFGKGTIDIKTGVGKVTNDMKRTINIKAHENLTYEYCVPIPEQIQNKDPIYTYVCFYTSDNSYISYKNLSRGEYVTNIDGNDAYGEFITPPNTKYFKFVTRTIKNEDGSYEADAPLDPKYFVRAKEYEHIFFIKDRKYTILHDEEGIGTVGSTGDNKGLEYYTEAFADTADEAYLTVLPKLLTAQKEQKDELNSLSSSLDVMYREGWYQDASYVEGDEEKLYKDSLDNLKQIAKPEATYNFTFLDLYKSNRNMGYTIDELEDIEWPDIDISDAAHLVDTDIDVNCWAYIDKVDKCYDKAWQTRLEINTRLSLIGQQSFTDVLAKIADVSNETKARQTLYNRAAAISSSGEMAAERLTGTISANRIYLTGGTSNWYTDEKGNFIFESGDGASAMMLTGRGMCMSQTRGSDGQWQWNTFATGAGFSGDQLIAGYISGERIEAGTIEADKLSAAAGSALDISSNTALNIFATEDGARSSGRVVTPDSIITIQAKDTDEGTPAKIDILTTGQLNMKGSDINIEAVKEKGENVGGNINVKATGSINIKSEGAFTVDSKSFNIDNKGNVTINGILNTDENSSSSIAGFYITFAKNDQGAIDRRFMYSYVEEGSPCDTVDSPNKGIYIGTDGINFGGGKFKVTSDGDNANFEATTGYVFIGQQDGTHLKMDSKDGEVTLEAEDVKIKAGKSLDLYVEHAEKNEEQKPEKQGEVHIGVEDYAFTISAYNKSTDPDKPEHVSRIYSGEKRTIDNSSVGVYVGTDGISLGNNSFKVTDDGDMVISGKATAGSCTIANWSIDENKLWAQTTKDSSYGWVTLSSDPNSIYRIWAGAEEAVETDDETGKIIKEAPFYVTEYGKIHSESGDIGGWQITEGSLYAGTYVKDGQEFEGITGMSPTKVDTDVAFWAGANDTGYKGTAPFRVYHDGSLVTTKGTIATWTIDEDIMYGDDAGISTKVRDKRDDESDKDYQDYLNNNAVAFWAGTTMANRTSAKFRVLHNGKLFATAGEIKGDMTVEGTTSSVEVKAAVIKGSLIEAESRISLGNGRFSVDKDGNLSCSDATVSGVITANKGSSIAGWSIDATSIYKAPVYLYSSHEAESWNTCSGGSITTTPAIKAGTNFLVGTDGTVFISRLVVKKGENCWDVVDFSGNFKNAVSTRAGGSWDGAGTGFSCNLYLWGKIEASVSMTAGFSIIEVAVGDLGKDGETAESAVAFQNYINDVPSGQLKATKVKTTVRNVVSTVWGKAKELVGKGYPDDGVMTFEVPTSEYGVTEPYSLQKTYDKGATEAGIKCGWVGLTYSVARAANTEKKSDGFTIGLKADKTSLGYNDYTYVHLQIDGSGSYDSVKITGPGSVTQRSVSALAPTSHSGSTYAIGITYDDGSSGTENMDCSSIYSDARSGYTYGKYTKTSDKFYVQNGPSSYTPYTGDLYKLS